jgi:hypothetical protein
MYMRMESQGGMALTKKTEELGYKTWTNNGANPDLRDERSMTNRLSHGMAVSNVLGIV